MPKGIMYVESWPASPEQAEEYHRWYNEVHMPELLATEGFTMARRFEPDGHDGPFVAIYEIEGDDLDQVRAALDQARQSGRNSPAVGLQTDPPPVVRFYTQIAQCQA